MLKGRDKINVLCSLALQDKSKSCEMLMFSLPELLNTQGTQKERDSFQFTQRGQLQVHAFDKGSSPHNTGEWKLMYGSHYPFHSFL